MSENRSHYITEVCEWHRSAMVMSAVVGYTAGVTNVLDTEAYLIIGDIQGGREQLQAVRCPHRRVT